MISEIMIRSTAFIYINKVCPGVTNITKCITKITLIMEQF